MPKRKVFMIVTNDKYEIPVKMDCVGVKSVAEYMGVSESKIRKMMCGANKWSTKYKAIVFADYKPDSKKYAKEYSITHDRTEYYKEYYQNNKEEIRDKRRKYLKKYRQEHKEEIQEYQRKRREKHGI